VSTSTIDQLRQAGLLAPDAPQLTPKGMSWLRILEGLKMSSLLGRPSSTDDFSYLPDPLGSTEQDMTDEDFVGACSALLR
jgi:hypothetical protein